MSNNDWYLTLLSAPIPTTTILRGLQFTPLWLGADTPSRKNRCMRWCIDLDVHILCTRMCDVSDYSLKIYQLQYTSYCHYCNSPPWSRVDTWSRLSSACTIWLCHRLLWCASTMLLRNANEVYEIDTSLHLSHYQCHLFCPSSYHPFEWHVSSKTRHIICLIHHHDRCVDDVDVLLSSALYLLPRHKISFDHDHSINGRRSSSILLICQLTTLSACWDHPYISSSIILLARLLQSKSWARDFYLNCPEVTCLFPTSHHLALTCPEIVMVYLYPWDHVGSGTSTYQMIVVCFHLRA